MLHTLKLIVVFLFVIGKISFNSKTLALRDYITKNRVFKFWKGEYALIGFKMQAGMCSMALNI